MGSVGGALDRGSTGGEYHYLNGGTRLGEAGTDRSYESGKFCHPLIEGAIHGATTNSVPCPQITTD